MSTLRTLEQHETEATARYQERRRALGANIPNGISCPRCQAELVDKNGGMSLLSIPPRTAISCLACGWEGTRVA